MTPVVLTLFEHTPLRLKHAGPEGWRADTAVVSAAALEGLAKAVEAVAQRLGSNRRPFEVTASGVIRPNSMVGVVEHGPLTVEILPKVDRAQRDDAEGARRNLLELLEFSGLLPSFPPDPAHQSIARRPLYEAIMGAFASSLETALERGLPRGYRVARDSLPAIRGAIDFSMHVRQEVARPGRIACRHQPHTVDTRLNRIMRHVAELLMHKTVVAETRNCLMRSRELLDDVTPVAATLADCRRIVLTRLDEHFRDSLRWAELILSAQLPSLRAGGAPAFALLFDMNRLFEAYVARLCAVYLSGGYRVTAQRSVGHLLIDAKGGTSHPQKPDIVLAAAAPPGTTVVLDTKYKTYPGDNPGVDDVRQMSTYVSLLRRKDSSRLIRGVLLYPSPRLGTTPRRDFRLLREDGAPLAVATVDISSAIVGSAGRTELARRLAATLADACAPDAPGA